MVKRCARHNIGLKRIATDDGSFLLQMLLTVIVVSVGIFLRLTVLQWTVVALLTFGFLFSGFYRSAAHLLTTYDNSISREQAIRIKAISNIFVTFTAGITLFSYLLIFVPKINLLLV